MAKQVLETANQELEMAVQEFETDSIRASDTLKEVVVYKIRAADANGEWTVSRRYSNFEQLHRQLRDVSNMLCVLLSSMQPSVAGAISFLACQACECEA